MERKYKYKQENIDVDGMLPFEDFSSAFTESYSEKYGFMVKGYADSANNNIILEGSFNRLLQQMDSTDFAIISAYRKEKTKKENILRNRKLRGILNDKKMGVHQLVGHWQEAPEGGNHKDAKKSVLTDIVERSYFIARPADMSYSEFRHIMGQAYSHYVKKSDRPFVFEGVESPSSISGMRMFADNGVEYPRIID